MFSIFCSNTQQVCIVVKTKMSPILKLFFLAALVFILIQSGNSKALKEDAAKDDKNKESSFVTSLKNVYNSHAAKKAREAAEIVHQGLGKFVNEVEKEKNEISSNRGLNPHGIVPNVFKYDILDPASATVNVISRTISKPIDSFTTDVQQKYKDELEKATDDKSASSLKRNINSSLAFISAAKTVAEEKVGHIKDKTTKFWNDGKPAKDV